MKYMHSFDLASCVENAKSLKFLNVSLNIFMAVNKIFLLIYVDFRGKSHLS